MLKIAYSLIRDYGYVGLQFTQLGVIIWCFYKLFTNHLAHMDEKIDSIEDKVEMGNEKINKLDKRVSTIEGQLIERANK